MHSRQEDLDEAHDLPLTEIVSGGQTGVDRAGLNVAIYLQIPHGGWCPKGRLAEDGAVPDQYQLRETKSEKYPARTEQNVVDSNGTLILFYQSMAGGTKLTRRFASKHKRPCMKVDLSEPSDPDEVRSWIEDNSIAKLNVAGPRESTIPGIGDLAHEFLLKVLDY